MKKTHSIINNQTRSTLKPNLEQYSSEKDRLIRYISLSSDFYGDKLIEFMQKYNLNALIDATKSHLKEFIATNPFMDPTREKTRI